MKRLISLVAGLLLTSCATTPRGEPAAASIAWPTGIPAGYSLVWSDEFDTGALPDPRKWSYDTVRNKEGWYNKEAQYYSALRPKNSRIEDGNLIIEAHREDFGPDKPNDYGGQNYTSARLVTQGKANWTYGLLEVRAKLACGRGAWPAIWLLPDWEGSRYPSGGEIDVMEHVGHEEGTIYSTIHTQAIGHKTGNNRNGSIKVEDVCDSFHLYQMHWTKDGITMAVDNRPYFHFANDGRGRRSTWPFDRPQHLILNVAVGGEWGGQQGVDDSIFPTRMVVDYVRVYQPL